MERSSYSNLTCGLKPVYFSSTVLESSDWYLVSGVTGVQIQCLLNILLMNDDSPLNLLNHQRRIIIFTGLTAAK